MRPALIFLLVIAVAGCVSPAPVQSQHDAQLDVYAAVFQALIKHNASAEMPNKKGVVLCLPKDADPDAQFLQRFSNTSPHAYPCSASRKQGPAHESVLASTGEPVIVLWVATPEALSVAEATIAGGYYEASESAAVYRFTLERRKGRWLVTGQHMAAIS